VREQLLAEVLQCGDGQLSVPPELVEAARGRCDLTTFKAASGVQPSLTIRRVERLEEGKRRPLEGSLAPWGYYQVDGDVLLAHVPDDMWAAESILRVAWQLMTLRQGGVLVHSCSFAFGAAGVAAIGRSGAGKSTLAALCSGAPGHAALLTDEISQLLPEGRVCGTPFRSNAENAGRPLRVALETLLLLDKGPHEALAKVSAAEAAPEILPQLYKSATREVPQGELVRRMLTFIDRVGVHRLTFRKDPAVGPFLREWVERRGRS
jgi:hypothetical protein